MKSPLLYVKTHYSCLSWHTSCTISNKGHEYFHIQSIYTGWSENINQKHVHYNIDTRTRVLHIIGDLHTFTMLYNIKYTLFTNKLCTSIDQCSKEILLERQSLCIVWKLINIFVSIIHFHFQNSMIFYSFKITTVLFKNIYTDC